MLDALIIFSLHCPSQVRNEWVTEIVRDINIINAYVRKRQLIEEKEIAAEAVAPTGDAERDKRMKKLFVPVEMSVPPRSFCDALTSPLFALVPSAASRRRLRSSRRIRVDVSIGRRLWLETRTELSSPSLPSVLVLPFSPPRSLSLADSFPPFLRLLSDDAPIAETSDT